MRIRMLSITAVFVRTCLTISPTESCIAHARNGRDIAARSILAVSTAIWIHESKIEGVAHHYLHLNNNLPYNYGKQLIRLRFTIPVQKKLSAVIIDLQISNIWVALGVFVLNQNWWWISIHLCVVFLNIRRTEEHVKVARYVYSKIKESITWICICI